MKSRVRAYTLEAMERTIQAIYEQGVLRPLEPISLNESQEVTITISDGAYEHQLLIPSEEWSDAAAFDVTLEDVRDELATIHGSLSQTVIQERDR